MINDDIDNNQIWVITFEALCAPTFDILRFAKSLRLQLIDIRKVPASPVRFACSGPRQRCHDIWRRYARVVQVNRLTKVKRIKLQPDAEYKMFDKQRVDKTLRGWAKTTNLTTRIFQIKTRLPDVEENASMVEIVDCLGSEIATLKACFDHFSNGADTMEIILALEALGSLGDLSPKAQDNKGSTNKSAAVEVEVEHMTDLENKAPVKYMPEIFFDSETVQRTKREALFSDNGMIVDFSRFLRAFFRAKREAGSDNGLKRPPSGDDDVFNSAGLQADLTQNPQSESGPEPASPSRGASLDSAGGGSSRAPADSTPTVGATRRRTDAKKDDPEDMARRARVWKFDTQPTLMASMATSFPISQDDEQSEGAGLGPGLPPAVDRPPPTATTIDSDVHPVSGGISPNPLVDLNKVVLCPLSLNGFRFEHGQYRDGNLQAASSSGIPLKEIVTKLYGPHVTRTQLQLMRQASFWEHILKLSCATQPCVHNSIHISSSLPSSPRSPSKRAAQAVKLRRLVQRSFLVVDMHSMYTRTTSASTSSHPDQLDVSVEATDLANAAIFKSDLPLLMRLLKLPASDAWWTECYARVQLVMERRRSTPVTQLAVTAGASQEDAVKRSDTPAVVTPDKGVQPQPQGASAGPGITMTEVAAAPAEWILDPLLDVNKEVINTDIGTADDVFDEGILAESADIISYDRFVAFLKDLSDEARPEYKALQTKLASSITRGVVLRAVDGATAPLERQHIIASARLKEDEERQKHMLFAEAESEEARLIRESMGVFGELLNPFKESGKVAVITPDEALHAEASLGDTSPAGTTTGDVNAGGDAGKDTDVPVANNTGGDTADEEGIPPTSPGISLKGEGVARDGITVPTAETADVPGVTTATAAIYTDTMTSQRKDTDTMLAAVNENASKAAIAAEPSPATTAETVPSGEKKEDLATTQPVLAESLNVVAKKGGMLAAIHKKIQEQSTDMPLPAAATGTPSEEAPLEEASMQELPVSEVASPGNPQLTGSSRKGMLAAMNEKARAAKHTATMDLATATASGSTCGDPSISLQAESNISDIAKTAIQEPHDTTSSPKTNHKEQEVKKSSLLSSLNNKISAKKRPSSPHVETTAPSNETEALLQPSSSLMPSKSGEKKISPGGLLGSMRKKLEENGTTAAASGADNDAFLSEVATPDGEKSSAKPERKGGMLSILQGKTVSSLVSSSPTKDAPSTQPLSLNSSLGTPLSLDESLASNIGSPVSPGKSTVSMGPEDGSGGIGEESEKMQKKDKDKAHLIGIPSSLPSSLPTSPTTGSAVTSSLKKKGMLGNMRKMVSKPVQG